MKVIKKKKKIVANKTTPATPQPISSFKAPSWATSSVAEAKANIDLTKSSQVKRAPEVWIKAGQKKKFRFLDDFMVAQLNRYTVKVGGRFVTVTQNPDNDLLGQAGFRPNQATIFEVLDYEGYTDAKTGEVHNNITRFFSVSPKMFDQLFSLYEENGPLNQGDIIINRMGSGQQTVYSIIPSLPKPLDPVLAKIERNLSRFEEFYEPASAEVQESLIKQGAIKPFD